MNKFLSAHFSTTLARRLSLFVLVLLLLPISGIGQSWHKINTGTTNNLYGIWGIDEKNIWVVGEKGTILKFDGLYWTKMTSPTPKNLYAIWGEDSKDIWAVGEGGTILKYDGVKWTLQPSGTTQELLAVWGADEDNIWAVGAGGIILKYDGSSWTTQPSSTISILTGIWGAAINNIWAVGEKGIILKFNGVSWTTQPSPTTSKLTGIWGTDEMNVWAGTSDGSNLYFNGNTWTQQELSSSGEIRLWGIDQSNVWAIVGNTKMYKGPGSWSPQTVSMSSPQFFSIWGTSNASLILTVGGKGVAYFSRNQCVPTKWYPDDDYDGYGSENASPVMSCFQLAGHVDNNLDCNNHDIDVHPGGFEVCGNGKDDDCDGLSDGADPYCKTPFTYERKDGTDSVVINAFNMLGQIFRSDRDGILQSVTLESKSYLSGTTGGATYASVYEVTSTGKMTFLTQSQSGGGGAFTFLHLPTQQRQLKANTEYIIFYVFTGKNATVIGGTRNPTNLSAGQKTVVLATPQNAIGTVNGFRSNGTEIRQTTPPSFDFITAPAPNNFIMNYTVTMAPLK